MQTIAFSDARNRLEEVLDRVACDADDRIITRRDAEAAIAVSCSLFNSLMETVHLLGCPVNAAHLARSIAQYRGGNAGSSEFRATVRPVPHRRLMAAYLACAAYRACAVAGAGPSWPRFPDSSESGAPNAFAR